MKKLFSILLLLALVLTCVFSAIACKKDNGGNDDGGDNPPPVVTPINPDEYLNDSRLPSYKTYGDIVLDGELSEGEWDKFNALETEISLGGVPHDVYWSSSFADEGLIFAIKVEGSPVYYNINRGMTSNSGIEIYIAAGGTTEMMMNAWQMEIMPNGNYQTHIWHSFGDHTGYRMANANLDVKGSVVGAPLNSPDSTGYIIECMVPWEHFGYHGDTKPQYINMDTALLYCPTFNGERQAWVSMRQTFGPTYAWTNPSSWYSLTEFGFYDEDGDLLYVINDNKEVENGSVVVEGTFKEGGSVTVTPDDGYVLKSLYINGVKTDSLYYNVSPMTDRVLYIDAEFKPVSGNPIEFNVLSKYHYTDAVPFGANVSFALENADGEIFAGVTDEDGKAVVYIPDGEYTIKMMGNSNGTIVIDSQSATTYNITLIKNGLSGIGSGATASNLDGADGVTIIGDE